MDRMEMRAAARAAARASRAQSLRGDGASTRSRVARDVAPPLADGHDAPLPALHEAAIDEDTARAACAPMGTLHSIVVSRNARGHARTYYVIIPDMALKPQYERWGLVLEPDCKVLVDAAALRPLAVLRTRVVGDPAPAPQDASPVGFNPYFDVRCD